MFATNSIQPKAAILLTLAGLGCVLSVSPLAAQTSEHPTLRAETKIYFEGRKPLLVGETLTLFDAGVAYDVQLPGKSQITVFDVSRSTIILLDSTTQKRTTLRCDDLVRYMAALRQQAQQTGKADAIGVSTQPSADLETGIFQAGFPGYLYTAETQVASQPGLAKVYNEFTAWATRLNMYQNPRGAPFARLALNEQMSASDVLPKNITLRATVGEQTETLRSEHQFSPMLSVQDRALISQIGGMLVSFQDVPADQFRTPRVAQNE
ncbi:hypothetical protein EC9_41200 [Rosistilla ulvae]|uniref:DUF4412 domain-containing protein n=1 Tax=Rosistilla ulvae TaxID=1930277 RepID=A0A517M4W9_9BACT|nr:hypothetical protein [Rosistilla ulvae]QDS89918.1 hypothetical protein EC9_41200 [Rosistilla ulvae]